MQGSRIKRVLIVALLGLAGVAVLALVSNSVGDSDANRQAKVQLDEVPDTPDAGSIDPNKTPGLDNVKTEDGTIYRTDPQTGRLIQEFSYARLTPREQGVIDMQSPRARLYLAPHRVIQLQSDTGRFVAPNNQPESGEFTGNLVITVFQIDEKLAAHPDPAKRLKLDLSADSPHRVVKIKLDSATFDTTLGEIRSDSKVELMTPATKAAYFRGRGLTLVYNEVNSRIDYLEITQGDSLRYRPDTGDTLVDGQRPKKPAGADGGSDPEPRDVADAQFYRVRFDKQVRAQIDGRVVDADALVVFFAVDKPRTAGDADDAAPAPGPATFVPARPFLAARTPNVLPLAFAATPTTPAQRVSDDPDAPEPGEGDLVLTWEGKMVMVPVSAPPPQIASADDTFLQFLGAPVTVTIDGRDKLLCQEIEYLDSTKTLTATGSAAYPLRIESPALGTVRAPKLTANVDTGHGQLVGAGSIRAPEKPADGTANRLPQNFAIDWSQRVDLVFAGDATRVEPGAAKPDTADAVAAGIESASFYGAVRVEDDQMKLTAERLTTAFGVGPGSDGERQLSAIDAEGDVKVAFEDARIEAATLRIETAPDDEGRLAPRRMIADGRVLVVDPTQRLEADELDVALVRRVKKKAEADKPDAAEKPDDARVSLNDRMAVDVDKIVATGNVQLTMKGGTRVKGDRLNADAAAGTAVLFGDPVRIVRGGDEAAGIAPEAELIVPRLTLERNGRVALAQGAGTFIYTQPPTDSQPARRADKDQPADAEAQDAGGDHQRRVRVTWVDHMRFDDAANIIQVFGDVKAEAEDSPTELNRLTAGQMTLELVDPRTIEKVVGDAADAANGDQPIDSALGRRQLRRLTARDNVVLLATKWTDADRQSIETRVRMAGPILVFNNVSEQAQIIGPGTMLIEDRRPPDPAATSRSGPNKATPISGRGATAFTWTGRLLLDNAATDMTIEGGVQLTHQPATTNQIVELKTDRLLADLESVTAIRAMAMTRTDALDIRKVVATGGVQVRDHASNRLVSADQLTYNGVDETVLLTAQDDRKVQVVQLDQPKPVRAAIIFWDLKHDTVEIRDVGF